MHARKRKLAIIAVGMLLVLIVPAASRPAAAAARCFPETAFCLDEPFLDFWERNGGLAVFGYPIVALSERELNLDYRGVYPTQWLERYRLEVHPEKQAPYDILLGRLGEQRLSQLGIDWRQLPPAAGPQDGCLWFAETGHNVCDQAAGQGFKSYWQGHGLEFDGAAGTSYAESLALLGLPLTEPRMETNASGDTVLTQWFERARFEWHPDKPAEYKVLLGLLGSELINHQPLPGLEGRIIYRRPSKELDGITVTTTNGARQIVVATDPSDSFPSVSPDGRSLALWRRSANSQDLYVIDIDSGRRTLIAADQESPWGHPMWSPDGRRIAFDSLYTLYVINADGSQLTPIMKGHPVIQAIWSPDGQHIAFTSWRSFSAGTTDVGIVGADGSDPRIIRGNAGFMSWSPDGTRFLFEQSEEGDPTTVNDNLYVINSDGTGERKLTNYTGANRLSAKWQTNQSIVYASSITLEFRSCEIVRVNVDSGAREWLTSDIPACSGSFAWSPQARFIAVFHDRNLEIWDVSGKARFAFKLSGYNPIWLPR